MGSGVARELIGELGITWRIAQLRVRGQMQYRASFLMQIAGSFIINFVELAALLVLFSQFDSLGGWSAGEVVFLYALSAVMFSLGDTVATGLDRFSETMKLGEFDQMLTRPISPFLQAMVSDVSLRHVGQMIQGFIVFGYALTLVDVPWDLGRVLYLFVVIFCGATLFVCLFAIQAVISFWTVESIEAVNAFTYGGSDLAQYPMHIFNRWMQRLFLWVIPVGFVSFLPSLYLLDKPDPLGLPAFARFVAPLAALGFAVATGLLWGLGVRHYRSTGS